MEILNSKLDDVADAAALIAPGFDEESIHAFRVAVKKLRAFLRLMESVKGQSKMELGKKLKRLYDITGEIRNAQLESKKITKQKAALPGYVQKLEEIISLNKVAWQQHYKAATIKNFAKKLNGKEIHKIGSRAFVCFLKEHIKVLEDIADSSPDDEQIHTGRKSVKDMLYNTKLAEKYWPKAYAKIAHLPLSKLDHLSDLLGDYNDERLVLESQLSYLPLVKKAQEKKALSTLSNKEHKLKEAHKQVLLKELKRFVTAAALK